MTATDPRPALAPAAEALAAAYVQNMGAGPPPRDDRARAECHRAGRAALAHLRQLLAVTDWAAAHLPEPAAAPLEVRLRWERGRVLPRRKAICRKAEDIRIRAEAIRIEPQLGLNPKPSPRPTSRVSRTAFKTW